MLVGLTELGAAVWAEGGAHVRPAVHPRALPLSVSSVALTHIVLVTRAISTDVLAPHPPSATPRPAWNSAPPLGPSPRALWPGGHFQRESRPAPQGM